MLLDAGRTVDPRDNLAKARRWELEQYAKANNVTEISEDMPAPLMRSILRAKGLTRIPVPPRPLGAQNQPHARKMYDSKGNFIQPPATPFQPSGNGAEVDSTSDLMRQWLADKAKENAAPVAAPAASIDTMSIGDLRKACKAQGVPMVRTDNMKSLREKLKAHGKNAA